MKRTLHFCSNKLLLALLFTAVTFNSQAQNKFNLLINQVHSYMAYRGASGSLNMHRKMYRGIQIGASLESGIAHDFSMVSELYFATKGSVLKEGNSLTTAESSLRLNTLELPVLARIHLGKLYFNAGPYASYLLSGRIKTQQFASTPETINKVSFSNTTGSFNRWETGFQAGTGYNFNLKRSILAVDIRYGYGLTSLSSGVERYNRTLVIGIRIAKRP